ncbi:MAG: ribosome assembly cofactor RimP [Mariprofundaceae bacterium]
MNLEDKILSLVLPLTEEQGVDVLKVKTGGGARSRLVQVIVDRRGGVDSTTLSRISRGLALQLDVEDLISGEYRLEVASPGLDWPLTTDADFERYKGDWIQVRFEDGPSLEGENLGVLDDGFSLRLENGEEKSLTMGQVSRVVREVNWKRLNRGKK